MYIYIYSYIHLVNNSCRLLNKGNKLKIPTKDNCIYILAAWDDSAINNVWHIMGVKMAFSCTWYPNIYVDNDTYIIAFIRVCMLVSRKSNIKIAGRILIKTIIKEALGDTWGKILNWKSPTNPAVEEYNILLLIFICIFISMFMLFEENIIRTWKTCDTNPICLNFWYTIVRILSAKQYKAQRLGAQYACTSPLPKGNKRANIWGNCTYAFDFIHDITSWLCRLQVDNKNGPNAIEIMIIAINTNAKNRIIIVINLFLLMQYEFSK